MDDRPNPDQTAAMPALFIVGAPRCGTTSLAGALAGHPQIAFSKPKEPHYFTALRDPIDVDAVRRDYIGRFFPNLSMRHRVIGEGSVSTIYDPDAVRRILRCFPNARFVAMVRNPLQMLQSYHGRVLFLLDEDEPDFRAAWNLRATRAAGRLPRDCRDPNLLRYDAIGRIGAALQGLFEVAGRERCHVVVYDDYARDPAAVQREVLGFVGLDPNGPVDTRRRNVNRTYRYRWLQRLLRRPPKAVAQTMIKAGKGKAEAGKKRPLVARAIHRLRKWNVVTAPRQPLDPAFRQELIDTFADDVRLLSRLIGRDLTPWLDGRSVGPESPSAARQAANV
jgi:hypothetical protein